MLNFTGSLRVFLGVEPIDLRKSFSGLFAVALHRLKEDPLEGALFVFSNRSHTRLKMLYWDGTGIWVLVKRLEKGTFAWPSIADNSAVKLRLSPEALLLLTSGVDINRVGRQGWFAATTTPCPHLPLIEPDGRISRIRLSEAVLRFAS